jgi:AAA ATPase-like protein
MVSFANPGVATAAESIITEVSVFILVIGSLRRLFSASARGSDVGPLLAGTIKLSFIQRSGAPLLSRPQAGLCRGREKTLTTIDRAFSSPGRQVFIYGDRGVGKTSLAQTAANLHTGVENLPIYVMCGRTNNFGQMIQAIGNAIVPVEHPTAPAAGRLKGDSTTSRPVDDGPQLVNVAHLGRGHERFVFLQDHDLGISPDIEVALGKISLQFAIGDSPEAAERGVVIELKSLEAVGAEARRAVPNS